MSRIVAQETRTLPDGGVMTVTEFEGGFRITSFGGRSPMAEAPAADYVRLRPGTAGFRRAMRVIDARVIDGVITPDEAVQREEDLVTKYDREGW